MSSTGSDTSARGGAKIQSYATHDLADPSPPSQVGFGRFCRFVFNLHHLANATLLLCALNAGLSLALTCYGLTIALAYLSLKTTHDRNMRYQSF